MNDERHPEVAPIDIPPDGTVTPLIDPEPFAEVRRQEVIEGGRVSAEIEALLAGEDSS